MATLRSVFEVVAVVVLTVSGLACSDSGDGGTPELTWYINPDGGGQKQLAATCTEAAQGRYSIRTEPLPNNADGQREQLVRRLAGEDSSVDLMSLDVVFVAEFANAGFLRAFDADVAAGLTDGVLTAPIESATWDGELAAAPFYANTQLLWYRKSVAAQAGLRPDQQLVTWDEIIKAAEATGTTVEVSGGRYEGYMVWINAMVMSAGGQVLTDTEAGRDAQPTLHSAPGRTASTIVRALADSSAADPQLSTATEQEVYNGFKAANSGFMLNWPYVWGATQAGVADGTIDPALLDDIAWARYPQSVDGEPSAPPLGGIHLAVGAYGNHPDLATDAIKCLTSVESQTAYMLAEGNPAARAAVYDDPDVREKFPMADLIRVSIDSAGPRPVTPYYADVSGSVQREFHPPNKVDPDSTPQKADDLIVDVLHDKRLL